MRHGSRRSAPDRRRPQPHRSRSSARSPRRNERPGSCGRDRCDCQRQSPGVPRPPAAGMGSPSVPHCARPPAASGHRAARACSAPRSRCAADRPGSASRHPATARRRSRGAATAHRPALRRRDVPAPAPAAMSDPALTADRAAHAAGPASAARRADRTRGISTGRPPRRHAQWRSGPHRREQARPAGRSPAGAGRCQPRRRRRSCPDSGPAPEQGPALPAAADSPRGYRHASATGSKV